jgi:pimeloyl-ACP methyl ester carboxylesterase
MEEPIRYTSEGREIFGMLHTPSDCSARAGILIVNSRVEYRVGPHRIYVNAARHWAKSGFAVLRIDFPGNGDSPGDEEYAHLDAFPVQPAVDGVTTLRERTGVSDVAIAGLCIGARNALFSAAQCPGVRHLLAIGMPFSNATPDIAQDEPMKSRTIGTSVARAALTGYIGRALRRDAWGRLLTGKSDYGVIRRIIPAAFGIGQHRIFEEPVFRSLHSFLGYRGQALFLFGTNDVFYPDFKDQFARIKDRLPEVDSCCQIRFVDDANHTFSRVHWQNEAIEVSTRWLEECFPSERSIS